MNFNHFTLVEREKSHTGFNIRTTKGESSVTKHRKIHASYNNRTNKEGGVLSNSTCGRATMTVLHRRQQDIYLSEFVVKLTRWWMKFLDKYLHGFVYMGQYVNISLHILCLQLKLPILYYYNNNYDFYFI